jgi:probable HAF family extracellular repeat protein
LPEVAFGARAEQEEQLTAPKREQERERKMKTRLLHLSLVLSLVTATTMPVALNAQSSNSQPPHYKIVDLGTLGGSFSIPFDISNSGRVAGAATTPEEFEHAVYWEGGQIHDVGALQGFGSGINSQADGRSGHELLGILSEISATDPLSEDFCGFGSPLVCSAGLWRDGVMSPLPTFGGTNSAVMTINSRGQAVGLAEDGVLDSSCSLPQKSHFQAAQWERGEIHLLAPLPGDEVGMALRNNERGQVVGTSGLCSNTIFGGFGLGPHPVLWDHGTPISLGTIGDGNIAVAAAINNHSEIFGGASFADGTTHPFRWTKATGIQDLGLLSSDPMDAGNTPFSVNDRGQMVGASCDNTLTVCRGYIWQDNQFTDMNTLLPSDTSLYVILPMNINESGQIAGLALDTNTFEAHAFLATPIGNGVGNGRNIDRKKMAVPEHVRKALHLQERSRKSGK